MSEPAQTDPAKWRALLQELSDLAIADEQVREWLTEEQIESRWLGETPATEEQIVEAERRLGVRLPPSYRAFLKVSNGWNHPSHFVVRLAGTEEIQYTRDGQPEIVRGFGPGSDARLAAQADMMMKYVSENLGIGLPHDMFGRGPAEDDWFKNHLPGSLLINVPHLNDDASYLMLNPATIRDGEMEAWSFATWQAETESHPSFWHLMAEEAISWKDMHDNPD